MSYVDRATQHILHILLKEARALAGANRSRNTVKKYLAYFQRFTSWAENMQIANAFPASAKLVAMYIAHISSLAKSQAVIDAHLYSLRWAHSIYVGFMILLLIQGWQQCWMELGGG